MRDDHIIKAFSTLIRESAERDYDILQDAFKAAIDGLVGEGVIQLKPDHALGGKGLEVRVRLILQEMKLPVRDGREKTSKICLWMSPILPNHLSPWLLR